MATNNQFANYTDAQLTQALETQRSKMTDALAKSIEAELKKRANTKVDSLACLVMEEPPKAKKPPRDWIVQTIQIGKNGGALNSFGCKALYRPVHPDGTVLTPAECIKHLAERGYTGKAVEDLCNNADWKAHAKYQ